MAYLRVHSRAVDSYWARFVLYTCAISGTRGSSGLGSVSMEQIDKRTVAQLVIWIGSQGKSTFRHTFRDGQGR